jgi:hypothetical protein
MNLVVKHSFVLPLMGILVVACGASLFIDGCIIADPPSDLPRLPERRPTIVRSSVVPSASAIVGTWPTKFIVPVEMSDPTLDIAWASFVDYNPFTGEGFDNTDVSPGGSSAQGNVRVLEIPIGQPSLDRCHTVEIVVALRLNTSSPQTTHTPEPPGGDIVSWIFSPGGDVAGCPTLDAGLVGVVDAGSDAESDAGGASP